LFTMTTARLFQAGLLNFSLVWLAVIMGAIQFLERLIPWTMKDVETWIGLHEQEIWGMVGPASVVLALVLFLALGSIAGVVQMFVRNYGFTLWLERRTLRRIRGLLTRSEVAIPLRRIQAARTSAHWIKRHFGLCRVDVQTMGGSSSNDVQELAPLATSEEAAHLLAIAGNFRLIGADRFQPVAPAHRWHDARTIALPLAMVALVAGFIWPPAWWGVAIAAAMGTAQVIGATPHGRRHALRPERLVRPGTVAAAALQHSVPVTEDRPPSEEPQPGVRLHRQRRRPLRSLAHPQPPHRGSQGTGRETAHPPPPSRKCSDGQCRSGDITKHQRQQPLATPTTKTRHGRVARP
jgi:putative membrane protein